MKKTRLNLKELASTVIRSFPDLEGKERRVAVQIYRLLGKGRPVSPEAIAQAIALPFDDIQKILNGFTAVYYDEEGRVIGFGGLALPETDHRFVVEGQTLYTWCAWDSLFIPQIMRRTAEVESICPVTGNKVRLTVTPEKVEKFEPAGAVMSFITPGAAKIREDVVHHFCHYVHFFSSFEAGSKWISENEGTFVLSIEEAYHLGRITNEGRYKDVLEVNKVRRDRGIRKDISR